MTSFSSLTKDKNVQKLYPTIKIIAKKLQQAKKEKRFVLVRFHHDADGISAALALLALLPYRAIQQNAAVYGTREAIRDLALLHHEERPLLILLDLGSGEESKEGLKLVKAADIEIIIIDHHPSGKAMDELATILNPWTVQSTESASKYPAGYLTCEVIQAAGIKQDGFAYISCAGDKSTLLAVTQKHKDQALVLDYLAMHSSYGNNLKFYKNVLTSKELYYSILQQINDKLDQITEKAKKQMKKKNVGFLSVYVISLLELPKEYEFPSKGKIATHILENSDNKPRIVLGYNERSIVMRANQAAATKGIRLNKLIEQLKQTMPDFIETGGGHSKAAALRIRKGFAKDILAAFLNLLETKYKKSVKD